MSKKVIVTGLRANGEFHLGNYLGAILPMIELQSNHNANYQINMFVPDLHSFTTPIDHTKLYDQIINNLKAFVAAGLDISNPDTYVYRQSHVPAHSELTWILDCFTYFGEASRMIEFKEKSQSSDTVSIGLFNYPVLMSADILLYGAEYVPVGEDQRQHLELARDIAQRMNNKFGELFVVPAKWEDQLKFVKADSGVRIFSLRNPEKKMAKSIDDPAGTILLSDTPDEAVKKIMSATTDSLKEIHFDREKQPGVTNLLHILAQLSKKSQDEVNSSWNGKTNYGELKDAVSNVVKEFLTNFQANLASVNEKELYAKLETDEQAMNQVANARLLKAQQAVGLRP